MPRPRPISSEAAYRLALRLAAGAARARQTPSEVAARGEPGASVAVIASSSDSADRFFAALSELRRVRRVAEGRYTFEPGVDVTDADEVKGLEWDYVVLPDVTARTYPVDDESRRRLHVAVTRAAHQLWVVSYDLKSRLLPG